MSFYFYDYETFGDDPKTLRIAEFAGIRTDNDLNIQNEQQFYCKPSYDSLMHPESCNIHGISPALCLEQGLIERNFIHKVNKEFTINPSTCVTGYNNIRFDDEVTRYTLYRNFIDPYLWSWYNNNSRWDLIDVVRMCYAFKHKDSLNWKMVDGLPSFKLEHLAETNNINTTAHNALDDVRTTIAIAKIIKKKQPKLFDYAFSLRDKRTVCQKIILHQPFFYTSAMYGNEFNCTRRVVALTKTKINNYIVFNLDQDPSILLDLTTDEIEKLIFTPKKELTKETERPQIKQLHPNKSPMFCPDAYKSDANLISHLKINLAKTDKHLKFIQQNQQAITDKIAKIYDNPRLNSLDAEQALYENFLSRSDRNMANKISTTDTDKLNTLNIHFEDNKLNKLFIYFKACNNPQTLNHKEQEIWFNTVQERVQNGKYGYLSYQKFAESLAVLKKQYPDKSSLWQDLDDYALKII